MVTRTAQIFHEREEGGGASWKVSFLALARFIVYGIALALTVTTAWLDFYATAGGLILPVLTLQLVTGFDSTGFGG